MRWLALVLMLTICGCTLAGEKPRPYEGNDPREVWPPEPAPAPPEPGPLVTDTTTATYQNLPLTCTDNTIIGNVNCASANRVFQVPADNTTVQSSAKGWIYLRDAREQNLADVLVCVDELVSPTHTSQCPEASKVRTPICNVNNAGCENPYLVSFVAQTTSGQGQVIPKLSWETWPQPATSCLATGGWEGSKAPNGNETLPAITLTTTYNLICTWGAATSARLTWTAPTQNTDGTKLTDLAGYVINYGQSQTVLSQMIKIDNPAQTSYTMTGLPSGTWYFAVQAFNARSMYSSFSNIVTKQMTTPGQANATVTINVEALPMAPDELEVD